MFQVVLRAHEGFVRHRQNEKTHELLFVGWASPGCSSINQEFVGFPGAADRTRYSRYRLVFEVVGPWVGDQLVRELIVVQMASGLVWELTAEEQAAEPVAMMAAER